jgi:hypothetical protein
LSVTDRVWVSVRQNVVMRAGERYVRCTGQRRVPSCSARASGFGGVSGDVSRPVVRMSGYLTRAVGVMVAAAQGAEPSATEASLCS